MSREKADRREELAGRYRALAEDRLGGEEVEAAASFRREVWWDGADAEIFAIFAAPYDAWKVARGRLLPRRFLLAVTRDVVHVFKCSGRRANLVLGDEAAVFARDDIHVLLEKKDRVLPNHVTLRVNRDGELEYIDIESFRLEKEPGAREVVAALKQ